MERLLSYPISLFSMIVFLTFLCIFHPIQWVCLHWFGYEAHKKSVAILNGILIRVAHFLGATFKFSNRKLIPEGVPIIFVANHQSLYDIIGIIWFLRKFHPKFVSKKELGSGVPSVSFNLRHGGSVLIDRKEPKQAIPLIKGLAEYIEKHNRSAVIFPEGTRSRDGKPKPFAQSGLKILCKNAPSAYIVPISINNSWKFVKFGFFPFGLGKRITFTIHNPIKVMDFEIDTLVEMTENTVVSGIKY